MLHKIYLMQRQITLTELQERARLLSLDLREIAAARGLAKTTVWGWSKGREPRSKKLDLVDQELTAREIIVLRGLLKRFNSADLITLIAVRAVPVAAAIRPTALPLAAPAVG